MRKENSVIRTKFISEAGSQLVNADYFAFVELDNYACYCIADGIDNDKVKESAKLAVTAVIDEFYQRPGMSKGLMKGYLEKAHQVLLRESGTFRLEASVLVIITDYKKVRYANAGNARMYHWRNGRIINQSKDQSLTQNLVERGDLALDKLEEHEERHNLYCYVGQRGKFKPYVSKKIKMSDGDIISLATCGIWENTGIAELLDAIEDAKGPEDVCTGMEDIVLSQRLRNIQNYTFACIYVDKVYLNPNKQRNQKLIRKILIPVIVALVILLIAFIISRIMLYRKIDSMWNNIGLAVQDMNAYWDEEDNNSYELAQKTYNEFDSKSELSRDKVIEAKYFLNLFKLRKEYVKADDCYEKYVAACKVMTCLKGKNGFERVENDGVSDKELSLTSLHIIDDKYLDKISKEELESFIEEFSKEYESLKVEYSVYLLLTEAKELYEEEVEKKLQGSAKELIDSAIAEDVIVYDFDGTDFKDVYAKLGNAVIAANNSNVKLEVTGIAEEYDQFCMKVKNGLHHIKGLAYKQQGEEFFKKNDFVNAQSAYSNAKDNLAIAGVNTSSIESSLAEIEKKISDANKVSQNKAWTELLKNAVKQFEAGNYSDAESTCDQIDDEMSSSNVSSGTVYDQLKKLQECIESAQKAKEYEDKADKYKKEQNYKLAMETYVSAQDSYKEAGLSDKEQEMREKADEMSKKLEEQNQEKETE